MNRKKERVELMPDPRRDNDWLRIGAAQYVNGMIMSYPTAKPENGVLDTFVDGSKDVIFIDLFTNNRLEMAVARRALIASLEKESNTHLADRTGSIYGATHGESTFTIAIDLLTSALRGRDLIEQLENTRAEYIGDDEGVLKGNVNDLLYDRLIIKTKEMPVKGVTLPTPFIEVMKLAEVHKSMAKDQKKMNSVMLNRCLELYKSKGIEYAMIFAAYCEVNKDELAKFFKQHETELMPYEQSKGKLPLPGRKEFVKVVERIEDILVPDKHPRMSPKLIIQALEELRSVGMGRYIDARSAGIEFRKSDLSARGVAMIASAAEVAARNIEIGKTYTSNKQFWRLVEHEMKQKGVNGLYSTEVVTARLEYSLPWVKYRKV